MTEPQREDGYARIESYGFIGDCRTSALIAADGSIDWMSAPRLDSAPVFAALLDPDVGGSLHLAPTAPYTVSRRYRPDTPILETTFTTADGSVTVVDALNRQGWHPLPWTELARVVTGASGAVEMRWRLAPGRRFGDAEPWLLERPGGPPLLRVGDQMLAVVADGVGDVERSPHEVGGTFTIRGSESGLLALLVTDAEPVLVPDAESIRHRVEATTEEWRSWRRQIAYDGPHADAVVRSVFVLKLLTLAASGANAAAPTTSLPEQIGGDRNYDYRYTWVRDTSFALDVLTDLELMEDVHSSLSWLLDAVASTSPDVHPFYTLHGELPPPTEQVDALRGYRASSPVHVGNSARDQRQLGAFGDLLDAVWRHVNHGGQLDPSTGSMLAELADRVCDLWRARDAGLWELGDEEHYTTSKIGCWVALDRAARLAERGQVPGWHSGRWREGREEIEAWVNEHCWSEAQQAYTMYAGGTTLDASVLLAARTGFRPAGDDKLASTIDAIRRELGAGGPLLYRYSGMQKKEGAFVACTFWLVEAMAHVGRREEARKLLDDMVEHANDVGLLSEEIDPATGQFLGNFPQGLSHLALIGAARAVADAS